MVICSKSIKTALFYWQRGPERLAAGLTSSDDSLYPNVGCINLFGKVPDGLVGVFVCMRVDVGPAAWKLDWKEEKKFLNSLNVDAAVHAQNDSIA